MWNQGFCCFCGTRNFSDLPPEAIAGRQLIAEAAHMYHYFGAAATNIDVISRNAETYANNTSYSGYRLLNSTPYYHRWNADPLWYDQIRYFALHKSYQHYFFWVSGAINFPHYRDTTHQIVAEQKLVAWELFGNFLHVGERMLQAYNTFRKAALATIKEHLYPTCDSTNCGLAFVFSGHSIGNCISQMLALEVIHLKIYPRDAVKFFGYAAPRCGDENFAAVFNRLVKSAYRYQWGNDALTDIPKNKCLKKKGQDPVFNINPTGCYFHAAKLLVGRLNRDNWTEIDRDFDATDGIDLSNYDKHRDATIRFEGNTDLGFYDEPMCEFVPPQLWNSRVR
ncbi:unnamed protein product, partial [Mesorhabditis spiculigera]